MFLRVQVFFLFAVFILSINIHAQKCPLSQKKLKLKPAPKLSKIENEVFNELNKLRTTPKDFIKDLNFFKKHLKNNVLRLPGQKIGFQMNEGSLAIDSAISTLNNTETLSELKISAGLMQAAQSQLKDLQENPSLGHIGKDGSDLKTRINRYGKIGSSASENINYTDTIPRQIILRMVIDDGVKNRHHRKNLLNLEFKLLGISCGKSSKDPMICVFVFADSFEEKSSKPTVVS